MTKEVPEHIQRHRGRPLQSKRLQIVRTGPGRRMPRHVRGVAAGALCERMASEAAQGTMTEAKQQEAGRVRFLLLPPLNAAAAPATEKAVDQLSSAFTRKDNERDLK